jgi:predicted small lipoprotein YifL
MTQKITKIIGLTAFVILTACGKVGPLEPRPGAAAPAKANGAEKVADGDTLMTPSVQTRPGRSDELLRRSERRTEDPFDLPPGGRKTKDQPAQSPPSSDPSETPKT